jgi:RND family efflux transporter MFP subunit
LTALDSSTSGRAAPGLRKIVFATAIAIAGLLLAFVVLTGKPKPVPTDAVAVLKPVVAVLEAGPQAISLPVKTQGTVEALRAINLVSQVGGKVQSVANNFVDGAFFRSGEQLLRIEPDDYEFAIARAESQVAAAEQRLAEERGRNRQAKREWRDLGTAEANTLFLREPQMKAAEAALKAAQADLAAAKLAFDRTMIRAPFDGRIATKRADLGQYIAPGSVIAEIYAIDRLEVRLPLNSSQLQKLSLRPSPATTLSHPVQLEARFGDQTISWQGVIRRVEAVVDRQSRAVSAIAEIVQPFAIANDKPMLTPGMFVQATIPTPTINGVTRLPSTALRTDNSVLVVNPAGFLQRKVVDVQSRAEDWSWVKGLQKGERVVRVQTGLLVAGLAVDILSDANPTESN